MHSCAHMPPHIHMKSTPTGYPIPNVHPRKQTNSITQTEQVVFRNTQTHTYMFSYVTTIKEKEVMNLKKGKEGEAHGGFVRRKEKGEMM